MAKNKSESVKIEERFEEITRRIDNLTTQLFASDSEYALYQIPEFKKRLDNLFSIIAMNDNEFRIFRDAVFAIQNEIYRKNEEDFNAKTQRKETDSKKEDSSLAATKWAAQ